MDIDEISMVKRESLERIQSAIKHDLLLEQPDVDLAAINIDKLVQPTASATSNYIITYFLSSIYVCTDLLIRVLFVDTTAVLDNDKKKVLEKVIHIVDTAVILTGVVITRLRPEYRKHDCNLYIQVLDLLLSPLSLLHPLLTQLPGTFPSTIIDICEARFPIDQINNTDFERFQIHILKSEPQPLTIPALAVDWPAVAEGRWNTPGFWVKLTCGGHRLVPVECGQSYTDSDWSVALMPFAEILFQMTALSPPKAKICYMAQYNLADQFPALAYDVLTPDFCYAFHNEEDTSDGTVVMNMWLGPAGTVSPLHRDPRHNVYVQVVGYKYFRLYPPGTAVYADATATGMTTTSMIDINDDSPENRHRYPEFDWDSGYRDIVLGPGNALFIPCGWWHYVRSLSPSIGVNFWF